MDDDELRKTGYRVKTWGIDTNKAESLIEGTVRIPHYVPGAGNRAANPASI